MNEEELQQAQGVIDKIAIGDRLCLAEIYREEWASIRDPKNFGKRFKKAVFAKKLNNIIHVGIRNSGRCDEYKRI
ncbi:MAG: hypothetical protein HY885_00975 [Deltaproteobacteria bacterium]|nr:hypothetical protein [Deltaproteobacteria bacterium]